MLINFFLDGRNVFVTWKRGKKWSSSTPKYQVKDSMVFFNQQVPYSIKCTLFYSTPNSFKEKPLQFTIHEERIPPVGTNSGLVKVERIATRKVDLASVCNTSTSRMDKTMTYKVPASGVTLDVTVRFKSESQDDDNEKSDYLDIADDIADDLTDFSFTDASGDKPNSVHSKEKGEGDSEGEYETESEGESDSDSDIDASAVFAKKAENFKKREEKYREESKALNLSEIRSRSSKDRRKESRSLGGFERSLLSDSYKDINLSIKTPQTKLIKEMNNYKDSGSLGDVRTKTDVSIDVSDVATNLNERFERIPITESGMTLTQMRQSIQFHVIVDEIIENIVEPKYQHGIPFTAPILFKCLLHFKSFTPYKESPGQVFVTTILKKIENQLFKCLGNRSLLCYWMNTLTTLLNIINKFFQLNEDNSPVSPVRLPSSPVRKKKEGFFLNERLTDEDKASVVRNIVKRNKRDANFQFVNPITKFKGKIKNLIFASFLALLIPVNEMYNKSRVISAFTGCKYKGNLFSMFEVLKPINEIYKILEESFTMRELQIQFFAQVFYKINCILFNSFFDAQMSFLKDVNSAIQLKMNLSQLEKTLQKRFKFDERERIFTKLAPIKDVCNLLMMNDKEPTIKQILKTKKSIFSLQINQVIMVFEIFNRNLKKEMAKTKGKGKGKTMGTEGEKIVNVKLLKKLFKLLKNENELEMKKVLLKGNFVADLDYIKFESQYKSEDFDDWERVSSKRLTKMEDFEFLKNKEF